MQHPKLKSCFSKTPRFSSSVEVSAEAELDLAHFDFVQKTSVPNNSYSSGLETLAASEALPLGVPARPQLFLPLSQRVFPSAVEYAGAAAVNGADFEVNSKDGTVQQAALTVKASDGNVQEAPKLPLFLPGVDRRDGGTHLPLVDLDMVGMNRFNSELSTEIGSASRTCSSSVDSRPETMLICSESDEAQKWPNIAAEGSALLRESNQGPLAGDSTRRHQLSDASFMGSSDESNRYSLKLPISSRCEDSNSNVLQASRLELPGIVSVQKSVEESSKVPPSGGLMLPGICNVRSVPDSVDDGTTPIHGGGLFLPGISNAQHRPPSLPLIGAKTSMPQAFPWRVKYVSSSPNAVIADSSVPTSSHECLTDDTTADGCIDFYEDDEDLEDDLELPEGVSKRVRFLPVAENSIHEYDKFDWEAEIYEAEQVFGRLVDSGLSAQFPPESDELSDDGVKADPSEMLIPLIGSRSGSVVGAENVVDSDETADESPTKTTPEVQVNRNDLSSESGRSASGRSKRNIKNRERTPHPCRQPSRTSSLGSHIDSENGSSTTSHSPFFPGGLEQFPPLEDLGDEEILSSLPSLRWHGNLGEKTSVYQQLMEAEVFAASHPNQSYRQSGTADLLSLDSAEFLTPVTIRASDCTSLLNAVTSPRLSDGRISIGLLNYDSGSHYTDVDDHCSLKDDSDECYKTPIISPMTDDSFSFQTPPPTAIPPMDLTEELSIPVSLAASTKLSGPVCDELNRQIKHLCLQNASANDCVDGVRHGPLPTPYIHQFKKQKRSSLDAHGDVDLYCYPIQSPVGGLSTRSCPELLLQASVAETHACSY